MTRKVIFICDGCDREISNIIDVFSVDISLTSLTTPPSQADRRHERHLCGACANFVDPASWPRMSTARASRP